MFDTLLADAHRYTEPAHEALAVLREAIYDDTIALPPPPAAPPLAYVDGAVAHGQSDAIAWIAAVACVEHPDHGTVRVLDEQVIPVSVDVEKYRSLLMGLCELTAATSLDSVTVAVDGGLVTSLLALAAHATFRDPDTLTAAQKRLTDYAVARTVTTYLDAVLSGRIVALPKQDTATGYVQQWRRGLLVTPTTETILNRLHDRPLIQQALPAGTMLTPRPAVEARRIKTDTIPGTEWLADELTRLHSAAGLHVTYVKPAGGAQRVIKLEYLETDPVTFRDGKQLAAQIAADCYVSRILEPVGQHLVDKECKRSVTAHFGQIEQALHTAIGGDAVRSYRT